MEINVPIRISLKDIEDDIFLGEKSKNYSVKTKCGREVIGGI